MIHQDSINRKKAKSCKLNLAENSLHNINNLLAAIVGYCDVIGNDINNYPLIFKYTKLIYKSIYNSHYLSDKSICLSEPKPKYPNNSLNLPHRKLEILKSKSYNKTNINQKILLVEDDEQVTRILITMLNKHKYDVVACSNGNKAFTKFNKFEGKFNICIVDVGLPDIKGPDLVKAFLSLKPDTNVLFTSGYSENKLKKQFPLIGRYPILIKPFGIEKLLHAMRSMIKN
jgi:CheY-like chemotaxis protein